MGKIYICSFLPASRIAEFAGCDEQELLRLFDVARPRGTLKKSWNELRDRDVVLFGIEAAQHFNTQHSSHFKFFAPIAANGPARLAIVDINDMRRAVGFMRCLAAERNSVALPGPNYPRQFHYKPNATEIGEPVYYEIHDIEFSRMSYTKRWRRSRAGS